MKWHETLIKFKCFLFFFILYCVSVQNLVFQQFINNENIWMHAKKRNKRQSMLCMEDGRLKSCFIAVVRYAIGNSFRLLLQFLFLLLHRFDWSIEIYHAKVKQTTFWKVDNVQNIMICQQKEASNIICRQFCFSAFS